MTFIRNSWYVAALSEEVTAAPMARTIVGDPVLLYREDEKTASALLDLCPHRFAQLSNGLVENGRIQCPYHGLEFNGSGQCVHNPHGNGARPKSLNIRTFPLVERDGLLWIWPGDTGLADPDKIPNFSCRTAPDRKTIGGHARVECNFRLLVDNLMDLGHAQYVHRANAQNDAFKDAIYKTEVDGDAIRNLITIPGGSPTVLFSKFLDPDVKKIDVWNDIRWTPASAMLNFIGFAPVGTPKQESQNSQGTHIVTPETEDSCHYFFGASRNFAIDDPVIDDIFRVWQKQALVMEDKPMVETIQRMAPVIEYHGLKPAMLSCDEAAVRVSRKIDAMELAEREPHDRQNAA